MNILKAKKRTIATTGQINKLRTEGFIPAVLYGGKKNNINLSLKKLHLKDLIKTETFMSKVFNLDIDGSPEKVLPRDVAYDPVSDEPIHIDFIRIEKGSTIILEIPVKQPTHTIATAITLIHSLHQFRVFSHKFFITLLFLALIPIFLKI